MEWIRGSDKETSLPIGSIEHNKARVQTDYRFTKRPIFYIQGYQEKQSVLRLMATFGDPKVVYPMCIGESTFGLQHFMDGKPHVIKVPL